MKTFLFIYKDFNLGGIQTYLIRTIKKLKKENCRIIWLAPKGGIVEEGFKKEIFDGYIEIVEVDLDDFFWINKVNINFYKDEKVTAYAFNIFHFVFLEMIKNKYKSTKIDNFFWVPHFKEKEVFIEEFAPKSIQSMLRKYIGKIIYIMEQNNNIFYVNKSHLDAFTRTYCYKVEDEDKKLLKGFSREILPFDNNLVLKRSEREVFNIITVGRFSFPHKVYIIGLIREYGLLKQKYNKLKLTIVGYGEGENKVLEAIEKLPEKAKKDVNFVGKVSYDELRKYFEDAQMNIGVAGSIVDGAVTGLISIPVRHYTDKCEGYGYLPESRDCLVSSSPGKPIKEFIEEVINMDRKKYLELSQKAFDTYAIEDIGKSTDRLFEMTNKNWEETISNRMILSIRIGFKIAKVIRGIKQYVK